MWWCKSNDSDVGGGGGGGRGVGCGSGRCNIFRISINNDKTYLITIVIISSINFNCNLTQFENLFFFVPP